MMKLTAKKHQVVAPRYKWWKRGGSRGWFYWLKKYRGDRDLDLINKERVKHNPRWFMPGRDDAA